MAGICPDACATVEQLSFPKDNCESVQRLDSLARIAVYACSVDIPDPITDEAIAELFADGSISASPELSNIVWADPTTEDILVNDCSPFRTIITGREMTAEDRNAISFTSGSPGTTDEYYDYTVYQDWLDKQLTLNYMLIFCSGKVIIPRDRNGIPLRATLLAYINYQKSATQGGPSVEFKRLSIKFQGDPLAFFTAKPAFNYIEAGIVL